MSYLCVGHGPNRGKYIITKLVWRGIPESRQPQLGEQIG